MANPERKGVPTTFNLDYDAKELLRLLVPSTRAYGKFLSELIRKEVDWRTHRLRLAEELASVKE
jgi:hypothetical protein